MKKIVIIGAGGFGREVAWLIEDINKEKKEFEILGFLDDSIEKKDKIINGYKVLGGLEDIELKDVYFTCAIGNSEIKSNVVKKAIERKLKPINLVHPSVKMGKYNKFGEGLIICAGTIITVNTNIEDYVTINLNCTIGHDTNIGMFTTMYPGVNLSGECVIEKGVELGTNSTIIQGKSIGYNTILGAGSVVVKNLEENIVAVGIPAQKVRLK
ncbi:acetyltransferase [uncultured Clostridium sp.]|uniref:acetyltransferase n=1 Tax=uncultured Clostridium sp. TaxID=59620 RepID=UPI00258977B6|nr:acetyltransferase [uncultured Clostridium sp.]